MLSWFSSNRIIRFDLGIIRRPYLCSDCPLSSIWPSTKHNLEATNRPHWSSISVIYFQRFQRWPIFNQLRANVACFLANNAWYPIICLRAAQALEQRTQIWTHCSVWRIKRGSPAVTPLPLFNVPKTKTRPNIHNTPLWSLKFLKKPSGEPYSYRAQPVVVI